MKVCGHGRWVAGACFLGFVAVLNLTSHASGQNMNAGQDVFARRCAGCHAVDSEKEGPRLRGVLGRTAGTVPGFPFSDALKKSGIVWTEPLLNKWLEDPQTVVKDNDMEFRVSNPTERASVVAYLKSLAK